MNYFKQMKSITSICFVAALQACSAEQQALKVDVPSKSVSYTQADLTTKHTSVFNKISYRIPTGWVVIDGESDWVAPSVDKFRGNPSFDPDYDAYYVVSVIFPYLTMEDMQSKRIRSFEDLINSTLHSLKIASGASGQETPIFEKIGAYEAARIDVTLNDGSAFHQVFLKLSDSEIASVAGGGPLGQSSAIKALVGEISETVQPSITR